MNATAAAEDTNAARSVGLNTDQVLAQWVQELVPFGIFTTDTALRVISWNEWLVGHSGISREVATGKILTELFPELAQRRVAERYTRALAGEVSILSSALHKHLLPLPTTVADAGYPHMLQTARVAPLRENGAIVGTITMIEDVTQREFQAGILQRQQELDRLLSASLATLLQSTNPAGEMPGIFASVSPTLGLDAYVCYLFEPDQGMLRLSTASGFSPKQRELISNHALSQNGQLQLLRHTSGNNAELDACVSPTRSLGLQACESFPLVVADRLIGLVIFGSFQRERVLPGDVMVLARISHYVAIALDRVRREQETVAASHAKDHFLAALSHELRTPLNPVLLVASDSATNPDYPDEARQAFRMIEKNALLEARLIDDLLDLTKIEHGKLSIQMREVDAHSVLKDAIETVRPEIEEQRLTLSVNFDLTYSQVNADEGRLQQVFWNVIKNAVKFTPAGGRIEIASRSDAAAGEVLIHVTDTGIGMSEAEVSRIFGAFSQGDHADRGAHQFGGLGLGLAISRKIVELHGGRISAASPGKDRGAAFTIALPLVRRLPETADGARAASAKAAADARRLPTAGRRILLVEDHESTRVALHRMLNQRGMEVVAVASLGSAVQAASTNGFDLVLSDIGLPDGDGYVLMKQLRDQYGLKGIALTGYGTDADIDRSKSAGFLAHLTKPINIRALDQLLERAFSTEK